MWGGAGREVTGAAGSPLLCKSRLLGLLSQPGEASEGQAGMKGGVKKTVSRERWVFDAR